LPSEGDEEGKQSSVYERSDEEEEKKSQKEDEQDEQEEVEEYDDMEAKALALLKKKRR
jgi:hypothetical protein